MNKKKKRLLISLISIACVIAVIFVGVMIYFFGASYPSFNKIKRKEFLVPGISESFTPQGLAYDEQNDVFLLSGYMSNGDASRLYVVDNKTKESKYITFKTDAPFVGHFGGVAVYDRTVWLASDGHIYRINLNELILAENEDEFHFLDSLEAYNGADWLTIYENEQNEHFLIVGEFYRKGSHPTDSSHHIANSNGKYNHALAMAYPIDENMDYGLGSTFPEFGISLPDLVQGMCFTSDRKILLSSSYSVGDSHIRLYDCPLEETSAQATINGITLNCHVLDKSNLVKTINAPCMSEGVTLVSGRVFVVFENCSTKYKTWARSHLENVYSLEV